MLNWWYGSDPEREKQAQINTGVVSAQQTQQELQMQRKHLLGRLEEIQADLIALDQDEDAEEEKLALFEEYQDTEAQVRDLHAMLGNMRVTTGALKSATTNKNVFDAQQGAAEALQAVNGQLRETDIERLNGKLAVHIDKNRAVSSAMTKPLPVRRAGTGSQARATQSAKNTKIDDMNSKMAKWSTGKLPSAGSGTGKAGAPSRPKGDIGSALSTNLSTNLSTGKAGAPTGAPSFAVDDAQKGVSVAQEKDSIK
jgi:hypothetical protein